VYYAGHGEMKNGMTDIVFNSNEEPNFEIEGELSKLATYYSSYTIAVLDCCRTESQNDDKSRSSYSAQGS
jgi:hypothetical protein